MLRPWIAEQSLPQVTRGLLFFAVAARGDDLVPGGLSPFTGPRASAVVQWLQQMMYLRRWSMRPASAAPSLRS